MKVVFVYNSKSGSALSKQELEEKCRVANVEVEAFIAVDKNLKRYLRPYIAANKIIAVCGGDGTISAVAGMIVGTKATLAPLPGGTLNHFTKDLGVPQDIDKALKRLTAIKSRHVDIGKVGNIYFVNNSSLGIYPTVLHIREDTESWLGKWPAAVIAAVRALVWLRTYTVTIDGKKITTPFVFVGNNRYKIDSFGATVRSALDEGIITVFIAKTRSRTTLLWIALAALVGRANDLSEFDEYTVTNLEISAKKSQLSVSHDGEVTRCRSPLRYSCEQKKLKILA